MLMCSAVNEIDISALETLEAINIRLQELDINLSLSEVKGPVMDRLGRGHFLDQFSGDIFCRTTRRLRRCVSQRC